MNSQKVYFEYLNFNNADLFTVICLPQKSGTFPTVIMRTPYVDDDENLSEEEICKRILTDNAAWVNSGYALVFQHCRGRGKSSGDCIPYLNERADGLFLQDWVRVPFYALWKQENITATTATAFIKWGFVAVGMLICIKRKASGIKITLLKALIYYLYQSFLKLSLAKMMKILTKYLNTPIKMILFGTTTTKTAKG